MKNKNIGLSLISTYIFICLIGIAMVYSATFKNNSANGEFILTGTISQIILFIVMILFGTLIIYFQYKYNIIIMINKFIPLFFYFNIIALILVLTPIGREANGAHSVIHFMGFDYQPLESYKIIMPMYMARYMAMSNNNNKNYSYLKIKEFLKNKNINISPKIIDYLLHVIIIPSIGIGLVFLEPDAGGAIILGLLLLVAIIYNAKYLKTIFITLFTFGISGISLIFTLGIVKTYQLERIFAFSDPFSHLDQAGMNLVQSFIAISNGGILGVGYGNSVQKTGDYLYASSTDFIFSIIVEELGLIGSLVIIGLTLLLVYQMTMIGLKTQNKYYINCTFFLGALFFIQTFINIGGVTGIIPMTGVTLPFISQGTNSFLFLSLSVLYCILISITDRHVKIKKGK